MASFVQSVDVNLHNSKDPYIRRCRACYHADSVTAGTLFHKVKFGLREAYTMVFMMTTTQ